MNETKVPSIIFERWMKVLRPNEFKILMMILFHGRERIYTRQKLADIMAFTGIRSHETVFRSISTLESSFKILIVEESASWGKVYSLNWSNLFDGPPPESEPGYIPILTARDVGGY